MSRKIRIEKSESTGRWLVFAPSFGFVQPWPVIARERTHAQAVEAAFRYIRDRQAPQSQYSTLNNETWGPWTLKENRI